MVVDNRRSPMEECNEDPFWEDLYEKFPGLETIIDLPHNAADIEAVIEHVLEEGRKRGVAEERDAQDHHQQYKEWLAERKKSMNPQESHLWETAKALGRSGRLGDHHVMFIPAEERETKESPSEEHVRQQEWRDKHWEEWMNEWKEDHPNKEEK